MGAQGDLQSWLSQRGLEAYWPQLDQNEVDLETLLGLEYAHLQEMGFAVGARLKLLKAIAEHRDASTEAQTPPRPTARGIAAERRQITAMFCDIVGYTHLSSQIDPEETRRLLHGYWQRIEETAATHHGHIAQYLGDGALIYFGYPTAREDDAERAISAGLTLLELVSSAASSDGARLHIRMGIATGLVVVGDDLGRGAATRGTLAVGQTVNLASRLQSIARPDSVVIDESTFQVAGDRYDVEALGPIDIAGLDAPVRAFTVLRAKKVRVRFEARRGARDGIVGRVGELAVGLDLWQQTVRRQGQTLLVEGEPGIGKSHFAWELARKVEGEGGEVLPLQCSPQHLDTPFYPLVEGLSWLAGVGAANDDADKLARFEALLSGDTTSGDDTQILARLVGAVVFNAGTVQSRAPSQERQRVFAALTRFFVGRSASRPLLIVLEDVQWCDPTTLEMLTILREEAASLPIMVVATSRHRIGNRLGEKPQPVRMTLSRLSPATTAALVRTLFDGAQVSDETLEFITSRTDGVPLFVEELARTVRDKAQASGSGAKEEGDLESIPNSLQGILMERLDALRGAKRVAQVAACIGRDFDAGLLGRVADLKPAELADALDRLLASEIVIADRTAGEQAYRFKHALACDAAYAGLLFSERRAIHGGIAGALASGATPVRPELLAHHLTQAQDVIPAIEKWQEAAKAAKLRSANVEAIAHIGKAMRLLDQLENAAIRANREFALLIELIAPYRATKGFAAREVADVTERAIALADEARDVRGVLPLLYNQWVYKFVTADREVCQRFADEIMARVEYDENDLIRMTGLRALAVTSFTRGELVDAVEKFAASIALYDPERQADATQLVGLDALVVASGYNSLACWCLGREGDAAISIERALSHARQTGHASTMIFSIYHETLLRGVLPRDPAVLRKNGGVLEALGRDNQFDMWAVCGRLLRSMGEFLDAPSVENVERVIGYLADYQDMGLVYRPTYETFIAEAWLQLGNRDRGLHHVERARTVVGQSGERWSESEICRIEAALLLLGDPDEQAARTLLNEAVSMAAARGAVTFEARARSSMAALGA